jgi:8-oxo-dGTP pyrophosphatase MutT (NUDIX family)
MAFHPRCDEHGKPLRLLAPSLPTALAAWADPAAVATVVPDGPLPPALHGLALEPWRDAPTTRAGWADLACGPDFEEPEFQSGDMKPAAGVAILEPDGRVWLVSPSNAFGGYRTTFPKGKVLHLDLRVTAVKEAFEETGLRVELVRHLMDLRRSTSHTRYYLARRVGGTPAAMGWESQAVHLAPLDHAKALLNRAVDHPLVDRLESFWRAGA